MISFQPNCTLPATGGAFIQSPNVRSTTEIIWSCLSITILCTWSVLHLNVPPDVIPVSKWQWVRCQLFLFRRKVFGFFFMLFLPEYMIGALVLERWNVSLNSPRLKELAAKDGVPWSWTHTYFVNMGGVALRFADDDGVAAGKPFPDVNGEYSVNGTERALRNFCLKQEQRLGPRGQYRWRRHARNYWLAKAAIDDYRSPEDLEYILPMQGTLWILNATQLLAAREGGLIASLPNITVNEIQDRDKSDGLVKTLAILQVAWLVAQVIVRKIEGLPSSQLEISTIALAATSLVAYLLQWWKPKDVHVPFYVDIPASQPLDLSVFKAIFRADTQSKAATHYYTISSRSTSAPAGTTSHEAPVRLLVASMFGALLLGGLHLVAWNFSFPTRIEQVFWQASALVVTIGPIIFTAVLAVVEWHDSLQTSDIILFVAVVIMGPLYMVARLALLVESFRALYFLPPEAFRATLAGNAPHVG
jgi:hypothetical protein